MAKRVRLEPVRNLTVAMDGDCSVRVAPGHTSVASTQVARFLVDSVSRRTRYDAVTHAESFRVVSVRR